MKRRVWTEDELNYLREHWQKTDIDLAKHFGRTVPTIRTKRRDLGLLGKKGQRKSDWSPEEEEQLRELWGLKTIPQISKIMERSHNAVLVKSKRLGLGAFKNSGEWLPALQIANILGIDVHTVTDYWIPKLSLPYKRIAPRGKKYFKYIRLTDLMAWLESNLDKWDSRRVEPYALGNEPEWLQKKRKTDAASSPRGCFKWTQHEDARLVTLYRRGVKIKDIAEELGRSPAGVEHRAARLDIWGNGAYIGNKRTEERKQIKEAFERKTLEIRLLSLLKIRFNELNYDGYWQKDICMNWHPVKGCTAGGTNCDECGNFNRIKPQYCVRCGATFFEREKNKICERCRIARKRQYRRKWHALHGVGAAAICL